MNIEYLDSEIGTIRIEADEQGLTSVSVVEEKKDDAKPCSITKEAILQLQEYFKGHLQNFDLPLNLSAGTDFYKSVWQYLQEIPYGATTSYLRIATKLGDPNATRAVGMANGKNPIAIIIPCHRVIGSNGSLTGYAYGTEVKRKLLALENPKEYAVNGLLF